MNVYQVSGPEAKRRVKEAMSIVETHAHGRFVNMADASLRQSWVIDQIVRTLLGPIGYDRFRLEHPDWNEGTAP